MPESPTDCRRPEPTSSDINKERAGRTVSRVGEMATQRVRSADSRTGGFKRCLAQVEQGQRIFVARYLDVKEKAVCAAT